MDFLGRLDRLMADNDLNKLRLSQQTGIPVSTIYGWYKKGYENITLPNLRALANFFGVTMEYLANGDDATDDVVYKSLMESELRRLGAIRDDGTIDHKRIDSIVGILNAADTLNGD